MYGVGERPAKNRFQARQQTKEASMKGGHRLTSPRWAKKKISPCSRLLTFSTPGEHISPKPLDRFLSHERTGGQWTPRTWKLGTSNTLHRTWWNSWRMLWKKPLSPEAGTPESATYWSEKTGSRVKGNGCKRSLARTRRIHLDAPFQIEGQKKSRANHSKTDVEAAKM